MRASPESVEIVRAEASEADVASEILLEAARWLTETGREMWYPAELSPDKLQPLVDAGELYLARLDGVPVGTVVLQWEDREFWPDVPNGQSAFIHRLAVRRSVAGAGVSTAVFAWARATAATAVFAWARATAATAGRKYLRLDCDGARPGLCRVYESAGFRLHSRRRMGHHLVTRYEMRVCGADRQTR